MHNWMTGIHLTCAALWIGCILTEALFERALLAGDRASHLRLAQLHVRVDSLVEIPAFTGVLLTGIILSTQMRSGSTAILIMMLCGLGAIITNVYCVWLVFQRRRAAVAADWDQFDRLDHLQHKFGALVLLFALVALLAGISGRG
jgi:putative copper export protein